MLNVARNLETVLSQLAAAAAKVGRQANEVQLVAVTKTHPPEIIREAIAAGQTLFGESKVQEARAKIPLLPSNLKWHFIGHLQKNKVRHALSLFELIHSVDSLELAQQIQRVAKEDGLYPRVLLEVNVAGEGTKFGFSPETLNASMEQLLMLDRVSIEGLITIPPVAEKAESSRRYFASLRQLRDKLQEDFKVKLPGLSMGMTDDYTIAVEEGASFVRVGTAIFGRRRQAKVERP
jgi:pyridoxal phosphate enzyme (YggS family)